MIIFNSNRNLKKISLYSIHLLVFLLSFEERFVPGMVVVVLVFNLFSIHWKERWLYFEKRKNFILSFIGFYIVTAIGMLYTEDMGKGWFDLEVKLSILFIPLLLMTSNVINKYTVFGLLKTFIWGVSLALAIQFGIAIFNFEETGNTDVFFYQLLSFFHHPAYFSMYVNFAIASTLVLIFHSRDHLKWNNFLLLSFLVIGVYQLSSRAGLLTLILLLIYSFIYLIFPKLKWKKMLYALFATVLLTIAIVYPISKYSKSFRAVDVSSSKSSSGVRLAMWKSSLPLILDNFVLGVGTGDVNRELQKRFAADRLIRAVRDNLNAHNQFLQTQVAQGVLGTSSLLLMVLYPLWFSIKKRKLFFPLFALILMVNFLTESVLNTQAGVVYYALMNTIVYFTYGD